MLRRYYYLAKPGIVYGNALTAIAGFLFASTGSFDLPRFLAMLTGLSLVIASSCVCNNILDRDMDAKMERTKRRAIPAGAIQTRHALLFALLLCTLGGLLLFLFTNVYALAAAALLFASYVGIYTPAKRYTMYSTHLGAIPGALPPVVGYTAVTASLDTVALMLFLMIVFWQMAHFFSIAIYRKDEYAAAGVPILTVLKGVPRAKLEILTYIAIFSITSLFFATFVESVSLYLALILPLCVVWLTFAVRGFRTADDIAWAKQMFKFSLIALLIWSIAVATG